MTEVPSIIYFLANFWNRGTHTTIGNPENIKDSLAIKNNILCMECTESIHCFSGERSYFDPWINQLMIYS